ncbi:MAG: 6-bladed beta-propeller [Candidatus Aminicenantaceae bacterium]
MRSLKNTQQNSKVYVLRWALFLSLIGLFSLASTGNQPEVKDVYKTGIIILKNTPGFGEKTDWDTFFYNTHTDITVAPDGSIFAASSRQHKVFKFDSNGNLIKSFGQKGQGPGDFNVPGDLSILDEKYLVVGKYAGNHRISLFDLEGHFVKVLKTTKSVHYPLALKDGKIAYVFFSYN